MIEDENEVIADEPELDLGEYLAGDEPEPVVEEKSFLDDIPEEDKKYAKGWNPNYKGEDAKSLKAFIKDGKNISLITHLKNTVDRQAVEFRQRTENLAKLHEAQLKKEREELKQERRDAINMSDIDELDRVDARIKELDVLEKSIIEPIVAEPEGKELAAEWDIKNQWINESNPDHPNYDPTSPNFAKAAYANQLIAKMVKAQKPISEIIAEVEASVADKFPAQAKTAIPKHLGSNTVPNRGSGKKILSWSDLSDADKSFFDSGIWATKQEYLQALTDDMESKK